MPPRISKLVGNTPAAKFRGGADTPVFSLLDYFPDEYLASNYGQNVKAVIPMNQNYLKGTGTGSKFDAIVDGRRTQTTRDNKFDTYAINKLQPNDTIAITGDDGRIQLAQVTGKGQVDPDIFLGNPQAIAAYNQAEGGVGSYANVTLMGSYKPKVIPLNQPFSQSEYRTSALPGNAQTLSYQPIGQPIQADVFPENIQAKINLRNQREQFSDTGLYKDSYVNWQDSPFQGQSGKSPYFSGEDATYPGEAAAGLDRIVLTGNDYPSKVVWNRDPETNAAIPYVREGSLGEEVKLRDREAKKYVMFMANANIPTYYQQNDGKHRRYQNQSDPDFVDGKPRAFASGGYTVYKDNAITEVPTRIPSRQMQSPDDAMVDINQAMAQGSGRENPLDVYRGNFNEPSLDAIEATARAGGSGTYVNPTYNTALEDIDTWNRIQRQQTQSQGMAERDKIQRGDYVAGIEQLPLQYDERGYLTYGQIPPNNRPIDPSVTRTPKNIKPNFIDAREVTTPSIGDFYDPVSKSKIARLVGEAPRNIQRTPEAGEAPQYQYSNVNEYGVSQGAVLNESAYGPAYPSAYRRPPVYLSDKVIEPQTFDRYDTGVSPYGKPIKYLAESTRNPIAGQERAPRGRWMGGGLKGRYKDITSDGRNLADRSSDSTIDPLNSSYQISMPQGTAFVPMQPDVNLIPRPQLVLRDDYVEPVVPFERQYQIRETGNVIPGSDPNISDAYLPVARTINGEDVRGYTPFLAGETREAQAILDQNPELAAKYYEGQILNEHLADVVIELGGRKYPLTPEATTTEYLPSKKQLEQQAKSRFGKRRISEDDDIDYFSGVDEYSPYSKKTSWEDSWKEINNFEPSPDELYEKAYGYSGANELAKSRGLTSEEANTKGLYVDPKIRTSKEVYADPSVEPTDIVGAIQEKERLLNRINAAIASREGSSYNNTSFPPSPTTAEALDNTNTLRGSIIGTRYGGGELNSGVTEDPRLLSERGTGRKEAPQGRTFSRFINEEEANRIAQSQLVGRGDSEYINPSDLNFLTTDAAPERILTTNELRQQQQLIADDIQRAKAAYTGLMSLEPQNEIRIVTSGDNNLAAQMQQLGMQIEQRASRPGFIATGSLPVGMPGENIPNLPVRYNQALEEEIYGTQLGNMLESGQLADRSQALMGRWNRVQEPRSVDDVIVQGQLPEIPAVNYPPIKAIMGSKATSQQDVYDAPDEAWLGAPDVDTQANYYSEVAASLNESDPMSNYRYTGDPTSRLSPVGMGFRGRPSLYIRKQPPRRPRDPWSTPSEGAYSQQDIYTNTEPQQQIMALPLGRRPDPFKGEADFIETPGLPNYATGEQLQTPVERRRNYTPLIVGGGIFGTGLLGNMYQQDQERQRIEQQRMMQQGYQ
jgi:hypothetical protein